MDKALELPVKVLEKPHWRVNIRPSIYKEELVPSLSKCYEIIEKNKLSLRGWDYPHLSNKDDQRGQGSSWIASWSDFMGHMEYWRFYQSGQFLHLFSVREAAEVGWREKLQENMQRHLSFRKDIQWEKVPGFISFLNFIFLITEIYEFATRLCQSQIYKGTLNVDIRIYGIQGFVLAADWNRFWRDYYSASENELGRTWTCESDSLVAESSEKTLQTILWFFERFGWLSPSEDIIRRDIQDYLKGKY